MSGLTDSEIMLQVKAGDLDKMSLLFERHYRSLYGFLYHMTHNRESSEDLVQTVFYRMLKYRHTFTGKGVFVSWMFHIGRNVLKDNLKKKKDSVGYDEIESVMEKLSGGVLPDESLSKKLELHQLYKAMEQIHDDEREIIILNKIQELRYSEIAVILNISEAAVKVRVHRAFCSLKTIYQQYGLL